MITPGMIFGATLMTAGLLIFTYYSMWVFVKVTPFNSPSLTSLALQPGQPIFQQVLSTY